MQTLVLMERRGLLGEIPANAFLCFLFGWFWLCRSHVMSCSFDLKCGLSLSFLDSIMMCVWCCFSLSFLLSKQKTFSQARSCHWFPAAVVWPGQNSCKYQWVYKVWPEYGIQEMAQFDIDKIFYFKKIFFLSCLYIVCYINIILNWYIWLMVVKFHVLNVLCRETCWQSLLKCIENRCVIEF